MLSRFPEKRGQHAGDQPDEEADRGGGVGFQEEGQNLGHPQKAHGSARNHRQQLGHVGAELVQGVAQQFHHRLVDAEHHTEHPAGDAGQHGPHPDEHALQQTKNQAQDIGTILFHIQNPFVSAKKKPGQNRSVGPLYHTLPVLKSRKRPQPQNLCNLTGLWGWGRCVLGKNLRPCRARLSGSC